MLRHVARAAGLPSAVLRAQVPTITSHSMDRAGIAPFEERAAAAEAQLAALEQRVDAVAAQGSVADRAYIQRLEAENGQLKAQNAKLQYRVKHVLRSLSAAEQAQKVQKLQYRVLHLMRALETAEARLEGREPRLAGSAPAAHAADAHATAADGAAGAAGAAAAKPATAAAAAGGTVRTTPPTDAEAAAFSALDIRVGQIVKVWPHADSTKLFCEQIDIGEERPRDIASGLRQHYSADDLQGRKVLVLCNLKPRKLAGYMSNGMVLCASSEDHSTVQFVDPPADAKVGDRVTAAGVPERAPAGTINPQKSVNPWAIAAPLLFTNTDRVATFGGLTLHVAGGSVCTVPSLANASIA